MPMLMTWAPKGQELLGAIRGVKGQELSRDLYPALLRRRLEQMVETAEPEDVQQMEDLLLEAGLLAQPLDRTRIGREVVEDNEEVLMELRSRGIPGRMPPSLETSNSAAEQTVLETNLLEWTHALVSGRIERG
jgi:hypothetical protein